MAVSEIASDDVSGETSSRYDIIRQELVLLSDWHRMRERGGFEKDGDKIVRSGAGRTRTLKPKHLEDFSDDDYEAYCQGHPSELTRKRFSIFNRFARSVCHMKAIARKEIFEAFAMALYVYETFLSHRALSLRQKSRPIKRFADLACSHGLLSWALLLLSLSEEEEEKREQSENQQQQTQQNYQASRPVTAVCIDIAMSKSSETAAGIFYKEYPQFCDDGSASVDSSDKSEPFSRWDYVEGPIENIVPHESTLLVGIHACGRLSDTIINLAISSNAPLALVPCCHSKKILTPEQAEGFAALLASKPSSSGNAPIPSYTLADFMDSMRKQRLIDAGYDVQEVWIPVEFSPKNRILLAIPPSTQLPSSAAIALTKPKPKTWGIPYFPIPLEDVSNARSVVRSVAGRVTADQRREDAHPPPAISVSVWLPQEGPQNDGDNDRDAISVQALQTVLNASDQDNTKNGSSPTMRVEEPQRKPYVNPTDGRISKTFRVHYLDCRNNKAKARARHKILKEVTIPHHFPNVVIRS